MADQKRQAKRDTRAERRAAEAAAAAKKAEQEAKERKQQTIIGAVVVGLVVVLIAIAGFAIYKATHPKTSSNTTSTITVDDAYKALNSVATTPSHADDKAGILVSKDGYGKSVSGAPTIEFYMEPICPGCGSVHRQLDESLLKMVKAGQINLDLHLLSFGDSNSTDAYSTRAFNGAAYISDHDSDPMHLLNFLENIYAEDFQPKEGSSYVSVSNDQLKEQAIKAGVSEDVASAAFNGTYDYQAWLKAADTYTTRRTELYGSNTNFSSPTLAVNGKFWDFRSDMSALGANMNTTLLHAIGLDASKVGDSSTMPSIGATGDVISAS